MCATVGDLVKLTLQDVLGAEFADRNVVRELEEALAQLGLSLAAS